MKFRVVGAVPSCPELQFYFKCLRNTTTTVSFVNPRKLVAYIFLSFYLGKYIHKLCSIFESLAFYHV